jgi:hypothetical protein
MSGLVMGVAHGQAVGAQMGALLGAQSGRALSHTLLNRQSLVSRRDCRADLAHLGLDQSGSLCWLRCVVGGAGRDLDLVTVTPVR